MNKILFICITLLFSGCVSYNVIHITENNKEKLLHKTGFYYNLPQTALKIDVTIKKTRKIKGPYSDYAERLLGLKNVIKENGNIYSIINIKISSLKQRDPEQFYFVSSKHFLCRHKSLLVNLCEDGMIESINSWDKHIKPKSKTEEQNLVMPKPEESSQFIIEGNVKEKIDTVIEKIITNDTLSIEKKILKKSLIEKSTEQKAKESADYLIKISSDRYNLITGIAEVNYSKDALEYMVNQLTKLEKEYLALFKGDTASTFIHYTYTYLPKKSDISKETPLFTFSPKDGIIKTSNPAGEVVTIIVGKTEETKLLNKFQSEIDKTPSKSNGFYYRVPETAYISIHKGNSVLAETYLPVTQFGIISHLPSKIKKLNFYPNSGAIQNLK